MNKDDIKAFRVQHGLTQKQLATVLGRSIKTIQGWEIGAKIPDHVAMSLNMYAAEKKANNDFDDNALKELHDIISRQARAIESLTETNRTLAGQLVNINSKDG
ncbi:hypothetical protein GCM10027051_31530 [Niabella terrae]